MQITRLPQVVQKLLLTHLVIMMSPFYSLAETYNVTSASCTGSGSIVEAVSLANANSGEDTISFQSGLEIDAASCASEASVGNDVLTPYILDITESVIFEGNGAKLTGNIAWVDSSGLLTPLATCPNDTATTVVISETPGLMRIGQLGQDNSGISVTVRELHMTELASVALVYKNASLILEDLDLNRIISHYSDCDDPAIIVNTGGNFTTTRTNWDTIYNYGDTLLGYIPNGAISGGLDAGNLTIDESTFNQIHQAGILYWHGATGSTVNIVSSQGYSAGGFVVGGDAETNVVNSLWVIQSYLGTPEEEDRIANLSSSDMNITASTLIYPDITCGTECQTNGSLGWIYLAGTGGVNFSQSAIGINFTTASSGAVGLLLDAGTVGGVFSADADTWIQPTDLQDASALQTVTNQVGLLTSTPGLPTLSFESDIYRATPLYPGELIDIIDDAGCTGVNALLSPIDNTCLTEDVLGYDRVDGNDKRDAGAIQLSLVPHLTLDSVDDGEVTLAWTRPDELSGAITSFAVIYSESGSASETRVSIDESNQSTAITGLTDGTEYEFEVLAVTASGDGASSNQVTAVPLGDIDPPVLSAHAETGQVELSWNIPETRGHTINSYHILWKIEGETAWSNSAYLTDLTALEYTVSGLTDGITYEFGIIAMSSDSEESSVGYIDAEPNNDKEIDTATSGGSINGALVFVLVIFGAMRTCSQRILTILAISAVSYGVSAEINEEQPENISSGFTTSLQIGMSYLSPDANETYWDLDSGSSPGLAIGVGYRFTPQWSISANYFRLGSITAVSIDGQNNEVEMDYSSISLDGYYHFDWSFKERFIPYAFLGINHLKIESSGDSQYVEEVENNQLTFGVGMDFFNSGNIKSSLEWRRLSEDVHFAGINTQFLFN